MLGTLSTVWDTRAPDERDARIAELEKEVERQTEYANNFAESNRMKDARIAELEARVKELEDVLEFVKTWGESAVALHYFESIRNRIDSVLAVGDNDSKEK